MQNHLIKVATAVPRLKVADPQYNVSEIIRLLDQYTDPGVLVFPELCITGYTCADLFFQQTLLEEAEKGLARIAEASRHKPGLAVIVGLPLAYRNNLYNVTACVNEGSVICLIPKTYLPSYGEFYEQRWFTSGKDLPDQQITFAGQNIPFGTHYLPKDGQSQAVLGFDICEDLWVPDKPSTHACLAGANIIVNPSASDELIGKQEFRTMMVSQQSSACYCAYVYVSSGTDESSTDLVFSGHSIIAENGRILQESIFPKPQENIHTALIDLDTIRYNRLHQTTFETRQDAYICIPVSIAPVSGLYTCGEDDMLSILQSEHYPLCAQPFVPQDQAERKKRCQRILQIQANGLATRVRATGIHNLVIGISGGLDSTLALLVIHEAQKIEPDIKILAYTMPNRGNTTSFTYDNAMALMKAFNCEVHEVPIERSVQLHLQDIGHGPEYEGDSDTAYENAQARMRTYILMDVANMRNGLVVGTGDLSELALGWCTYNGDHMSMYGVNAGVPKTLVRYVVETYADTQADDNLRKVLHAILDTPISPELTPNQNNEIAQKTEEKIGSYDLNDFFLFYTVRYGFTAEKLMAFARCAFPTLSREQLRDSLKRFYNRFFHQQFKRSCLPDGPKVGSVTLSPRGDWRMPSDASVSQWLSYLNK